MIVYEHVGKHVVIVKLAIYTNTTSHPTDLFASQSQFVVATLSAYLLLNQPFKYYYFQARKKK
jgi:hypothetical protein